MILAAGAYRYRPLRLGLVGWDVWSLQKALGGLSSDGSFGPVTLEAVESFQERVFEDPQDHDGVAGIKTQTEVIKINIWPVQTSLDTPPGLLRGVVEGECGFQIGSYTKPYPNGTRDLGVCMFNLLPSTPNLEFAFDPRRAITETAKRLVEKRDEYLLLAGVKGDQRAAMRYAVLHHNWPAAADRYADGTIGNWTYVSRGVRYRMDSPAPWITEIGVEGVWTGHQWARHYVDSKVLHAKSLL